MSTDKRTSKQRVLVTSPIPDSSLRKMHSAGWEVTYIPDAERQDVLTNLDGHTGLIINTKTKADRALLKKGKDLTFVGRLGSGLDIIDLVAAEELNIRVYNSPEGNCNAVSEHVIAMILAFYNKLLAADKAVRNRDWRRELYRGRELSHKTIGIIGFGNTGRALYKRLRGFEPQILVYDPYVSVNAEGVIQVNDLRKLAALSHVISFHVQLTDETRYMGNLEFYRACKQNPLIVNTSRGAVVDLKDLLKALDEGLVRGACLDVFENEKPETFSEGEKELYPALYRRKNVLLSPHVAGWSEESKTGIVDVLIEKICTMQDRV